MSSSDGYSNVGHDEVRAAQVKVVDDLIAHAEQGGAKLGVEELTGEIMSFGRTLFKWSRDQWIVLDHVISVSWENDQELYAWLADGRRYRTTDHETIDRFWAEWEEI